ncbi:MAG: hypothetical protein GXO48_05895 [Chlorobi bacterium]|nr:hypothetical protein [Chlorobiota bacterium]
MKIWSLSKGFKLIGGLFVIGMGALLFQCKEDPCATVMCFNGICVDGACQCFANYGGTNCEIRCVNGQISGTACECEDGWEGPSCESPINKRFEGIYKGFSICQLTDTVAIERAYVLADKENPVVVYIDGFGGFTCNFSSIVAKFVLEQNGSIIKLDGEQVFCNNKLYLTNGQGRIDKQTGQIYINYTYIDSSFSGNQGRTDVCDSYLFPVKAE